MIEVGLAVFLALAGTVKGDEPVTVTFGRRDITAGGMLTRYWDCCKPSGSWTENFGYPTVGGNVTLVNHPVYSCEVDGVTRVQDPHAGSACDATPGSAYTCNFYQPIISKVNSSISYAFAAMSSSLGQSEFLCGCYEITATSYLYSTQLDFEDFTGKTLIVQAINEGGDVGGNNMDIQIPGGGVGAFDACTAEYNAPVLGWGDRFGGVENRTACDALPLSIRNGCYWRFDW
ncbi:hypothetical protein HDU82_004753 [Entophlyctis luteolus]|nr:hypothetical protein HDU82_004753 [Entophlyctis luteolus]KAJ3380750.1 hypothetical protein HDU84_005626 [Entophlyctis sp. JEL0112]